MNIDYSPGNAYLKPLSGELFVFVHVASEPVTIRESEESEAIDSAVDNMEMVLEDLKSALEEG